MNVENRKLFTNRDARAKLATMGGILASSPELLGEAQKFQEAGPVAPSTFLVQLPGLVGGNEFLQLTAAELQLLNEKQPGLMTSEGVMIQEATPEILSNLNPAQVNTTDNPNIKRMFADLGVELSQEQGPIEAEGSSFLDKIIPYLTPSGEPSGSSALDELRAARSGIATTEGVLGPSSALDELRATQADIATTEMFGTGDQQAPQQQVGEPVRDSSGNLLPVAEPVYEQTARRIADSTGITSLPATSALDDLRAAQATVATNEGFGKSLPSFSGEGLLNYFANPKKGFVTVPDPDKNDPRRGPRANIAPDEAQFTVTNSGEFPQGYPTGGGKLEEPDIFGQALAQRLMEGRSSPEAGFFEDVKSNINELGNLGDPGVGGPEVTSEDIDKAVKEAESEKAAAFADEKVNPQGPNRSFDTSEITKNARERAQKAADSTTKMSEQGPNFVFDPEKIQKEIDEGGSGSNSIIGDATGTNQNLSPKDSVKAYQAMYKEMLGMDDEDEEKEKWHQMAMIGFAIAAGQDPNALSNIAGGLLEGTKMARKDRMRKKDREDKFTMMAIQAADADRRAAIAAGATVNAADRKYNRDVALIEKRAGIATETAKTLAETTAERDKKLAESKLVGITAAETFLKSKAGQISAGLYKNILANDSIDPKMKNAEFLKRSGVGGPKFLEAMGIVGSTSPGVGGGVTGTGAKLTDIPD